MEVAPFAFEASATASVSADGTGWQGGIARSRGDARRPPARAAPRRRHADLTGFPATAAASAAAVPTAAATSRTRRARRRRLAASDHLLADSDRRTATATTHGARRAHGNTGHLRVRAA